MKFLSIFQEKKKFNLIIENPEMLLDKNLFKTGSEKTKTSFKLEQIKIKNGTLVFKIDKATFKINKLNLTSIRNEDKIIYYVKAPFLEAELPIQSDMVKFHGRFTGKLYQQNRIIEISSANWKTDFFNLKVSGMIAGDNGLGLTIGFSGNPQNILYPVLKEFNLSGFISSRLNVLKKQGEEIKINGRFKSKSFYIGKEKFSNLKGEINWNSFDKRINLKSYLQTGKTRSFVRVNTEGSKTFIKAKNFPAPKTGKLVSIYNSIPIAGMIETGSIEINKEKIQGELLLKKTKDSKDEFNIDGLIDFVLKKKDKITSFKSERLKTEFGDLAIEGKFNSINKELEITAKAKISEMSGLNKYSNHFIELDLSRWNLKHGTGYFTLGLEKKEHLKFNAEFLGKDFFINDKTIDSLSLSLNKKNELIMGNIVISDKALRTSGIITIDNGKTIFDFTKINGQSEKIFKILDIPSPTIGNIYGNCKYVYKKGKKNPFISGQIKSKELLLADFKFLELSCSFESDTSNLFLRDIDYIFMNGRGNANVYFDFLNLKYNISGKVLELDISQVYNELSGRGKLTFSGNGKFFIDPINLKYNFSDISYYKNRKFSFTGESKIFTDFNNFNLSSDGVIHNSNFKSKFLFNFNKKKEQYNGNYSFNIEDIDLIMPWENNIGKISIKGRLHTDINNNIINTGIANFKGSTIAIPDFSHAIKDYSGFITYNNSRFTLESLTGTLGGGRVNLSGYVFLKEQGVDKAQLNLTGDRMKIFPMNRTQFDMNADLSINYLNEQLSLDGNINVISGIWEREIDEGISFYTSSKLSPARANIVKNMQFDLRIYGKKNIKMTNSFGSIAGSFDLTLKGTPETPIILGVMEGKTGEIYFSNSKFRLTKAKLLFNNKLENNPEIIMNSEAFIKNYMIQFNIKGTAEKPIPEFKASPTLPKQEILALISLGELFEKQSSVEFSSQIGSTYLLSNALTDKIQKRAKKFGIDLLRIDTSLSKFSTDNSPRLTVGTAVLKDMLIVYSTNITGLRREVVYFQYQLSPTISLIGMRNEDARFSVDIRFRKKD